MCYLLLLVQELLVIFGAIISELVFSDFSMYYIISSFVYHLKIIIIKFTNLLSRFVKLHNMFYFTFLHTRSLLISYAYVSIESIDSILLSSFEVKAIFLIFSIKTLCVSLLNLCCVFNISLLFFMNSLRSF